MVLFTMLYNEIHELRRQEYQFCIEQNLQNQLIDKIVVFYDDSLDSINDTPFSSWLKSMPIKVVYVQDRITYGFAFDYANKYFPEQKIILSNGDIYFDRSLSLIRDISLVNTFASITRDDFRGTGGEGSSDTWIFTTPITSFGDEVMMGTTFCDQIISYLALKCGFNVVNPCLSINCIHQHSSAIRNQPGTALHNPSNSTTSDNMLNKAFDELADIVSAKYGIVLMKEINDGGGKIPPCLINIGKSSFFEFQINGHDDIK